LCDLREGITPEYIEVSGGRTSGIMMFYGEYGFDVYSKRRKDAKTLGPTITNMGEEYDT
jgi:hypothetical protein